MFAAPSPAREPDRARRRQRPAGARLHARRARPRAAPRARWAAFGWDVHEVDGHDADALAATIAALDTRVGRPHVLLAATTFGKGVSFMESRIEWHYLPLDRGAAPPRASPSWTPPPATAAGA